MIDFVVNSIIHNKIDELRIKYKSGELNSIAWYWVSRKLFSDHNLNLTSQQLFLLVTGEDYPLCKICKEKQVSSFISFKKGYNLYCSKSCAKLDPIVESKKKKTLNSNSNWKENALKKLKQTCLLKYGTTFAIANTDIKLKRKLTNLEKYGAEEVLSSKSKLRQAITCDIGLNKFWERVTNLNEVEPLFNKSHYKNSLGEYNWQCKFCNYTFIDNANCGKIPKCPKCFPKTVSLGERAIFEFVISCLPENTDVRSRYKLDGVELDIFIPSKRLAIEFNGIYWHSEIRNTNKNYHLEKLIFCQKNSIKLLQFWETQWYNKNKIVKSIISSALGVTQEVIYARKCDIKEISETESSLFLENNHLSGHARGSKLRLGLFYNDKLIQVATFGIPRYSKSKNEIEIYRLASNINTTIIGGASKLINAAKNRLNIDFLISFCDKMIFEGNVYKQLGFSKIDDGKPCAWYFYPGGELKHRSTFQKKKLLKMLQLDSSEKTEFELAQELKLNRVWDCGSSKWRLNINKE